MHRNTHRIRTLARLPRAALGTVIVLALALVAAAPAAAAQPTKTVMTFAPGVSHYPAGTGCTFDVTAYRQPGARVTIKDFSDGTEVIETHNMHRTIVNDATGATFADNLEAHEVDRVDPATGVIQGSVKASPSSRSRRVMSAQTAARSIMCTPSPS